MAEQTEILRLALGHGLGLHPLPAGTVPPCRALVRRLCTEPLDEPSILATQQPGRMGTCAVAHGVGTVRATLGTLRQRGTGGILHRSFLCG
jgi:hypothetical protein